MYDIALSVAACLRADTRVSVAWIVKTVGFSAPDRTQALALTSGGGKVGSLLSGVLDDQLADLHNSLSSARLVDLAVGPLEASLAGLPAAGTARCLVVPAERLPVELWGRLTAREPVCLVTRLEVGGVGATTLFSADSISDAPAGAARLFSQRLSATSVDEDAEDSVVTVLWPVPKLVIVGRGPIADALTASAQLLGWHTQVFANPEMATAVIAGLKEMDKVLVMGHDVDVAGPALLAALSSDVGYVGALGGMQVQQGRAEWLARQGVTDVARIHGPAGLDIGAGTPAEIAVSIVAEALAVVAGKPPGSRSRLP